MKRPASISLQAEHVPHGGGVIPVSAIERLGENARDRGLADAAGACKQIGMVQSLLLQRVDKRPDTDPARSIGKSFWGAICGQEPDSATRIWRR